MASCLLKPQELQGLASGRMTDPFALLGYHHGVHQGKTYGLIRVYNPAFRKVTILHDGKATECGAVSGDGCFEAWFPDALDFFPYRIRAEDHHGNTAEYDDPYACLPVLSDYDLHLLGQGTHYRLWTRLGANPTEHHGLAGVHFAVWAPNAEGVSLIADFNGWNPRAHPLRRLSFSGIWEIFIPHAAPGAAYKYLIQASQGRSFEKLDPLAKATEMRPRTAGVVTGGLKYAWNDAAWMLERTAHQSEKAPISIYEVHLGSWKRVEPSEDGFPTWEALADHLIPYASSMGYTHLELLPVQEHPLDESWGYQVTGFYAPTRRYGSPEGMQRFIDRCHQAGLGVILDWVPGHFPSDAHGLDAFDGTQLYAHEDPRKGQHPQWGTRIFNYGRKEVANFLLANALYWLEEFHADGLRVDAVASMLYLDYAREAGEWIPNPDGSNVNHEAVEFLKHLNSIVHSRHPGTLVIAEESSAFPGVTHALDKGGLGFDYKWNLGWMHDFLTYLSKEPVYRRYHQGLLTFEMSYAFSERFQLVWSHDEVVHGKGSLPRKMPGDDWQKFANARAGFAYLFTHPGKKLHFMGLEFGAWSEWDVKNQLDWSLTEHKPHRGLQALVKCLNTLYRDEPALHALEQSWEGFQWIDFQDADHNILSFLRKAPQPGHPTGAWEVLVCVFNFSPLPRHHYRVGVPFGGYYRELLNTDAELFGGSNLGNLGGRWADSVPMHHFPFSLELTLPPLSGSVFKMGQSPEGG